MCVLLTKCTGLTAMLHYVLIHLLSQANLSRCKDSYITSCSNQGCPLTPSRRPQRHYSFTTAKSSGYRSHLLHQTRNPPSCSTNPNGGTVAIFLHYVMGWHSCGHLLLPILTAPSRHLAFPTMSRLPQALQLLPSLPPTSPTSAPSCFSKHVTASSGTPS